MSRRGRVTARKVAPKIIEPVPVSFAPSEFGDDAQRKWVAANAGEMFAEQVGGSTVVAGCRCSDHLDVVTFPAHLAAADGSVGVFGDGVEIGGGEPEGGIGGHRETQCRHSVWPIHGLLRLAIEGCGLAVGADHPTVVLDCWSDEARLVVASVGLVWIMEHDSHVGPEV